MAVEIVPRPLPTAGGPRPLPVAVPHPSPFRRFYGLGSVFGKTLRDSRVSAGAIVALLGTMVVMGGATMSSTYGTPATRQELADLATTLPPIMRGVYGNPVRVDTLGGFISWHYGAYLALLVGLWSIMALSSTLAGEARRASLEFAVATQLSRRRIAFEKIAGHVAALAIAMAVIALAAWAAGALFGRLPGDSIAPDGAVAFAIGLGVKGLVAGALAFALAAIVGRGAAAGLAGAVMLGGYVLNSYRTVVPAFDPLAHVTWFSWTADYIPLAGRFDWPGVALAAIVAVALLAIGVELFARRDVGAATFVRIPGLPRVLLGLRGPVRRSFGELLPSAIAWGIGLGIYGFVMAASSRAFIDEIAKTPDMAQAIRSLVPGIDMTTSSGYLQLAFVEIGFLLAGLAAATLLASHAADEAAGRTELLLATPLTRARWSVAGGIAVYLGVATTMAVLAVAIGSGVAVAGDDALQPVTGTIVVAVYGAALGGVGLAVGGLVRSSLAVPTVVAATILTFLLDLLAPALKLPDWVAQLALSSHLGEPMVGRWDAAGLAVCVILAAGGVVAGAWGIRRRDLGA